MARVPQRHILVLSTGQHVGKTTTCLGLVHSLKERLALKNKQVAYCKPVGQQHVDVGQGLRVDKDAYLFKDYFSLIHDYKHMSPVIFPRGFTRDFLDGKISSSSLLDTIQSSHQQLVQQSDFVVCEGTGHTGVGSICEVNNAQVAARLGMDAICVAPGGLGSSFDQLALNREMLEKHGVKLKGVILNKVNPEKLEMISDYFSKALSRWDVELMGCIPQLDALSHPSIADFSKLLKADIVSGHDSKLRYFQKVRLAVAPVDDRNVFKPIPNQLIISHSGRQDVIDAMIQNQAEFRKRGKDLHPGLILTGWDPPNATMLAKLNDNQIPCIYVPSTTSDSYTLTARVANFIAKLSRADEHRLKLTIKHVCDHVDFNRVLF